MPTLLLNTHYGSGERLGVCCHFELLLRAEGMRLPMLAEEGTSDANRMRMRVESCLRVYSTFANLH